MFADHEIKGYVRVLCGSLEHLPSAIAELDQQEAQETAPLKRENRDAKLLKRIGALLVNERTLQNNGGIGCHNASAACCGN